MRRQINLFKKAGYLVLICFMLVSLSGCYSPNDIKYKLGYFNKDFQSMREGKIKKVIIQNTRDSGFSFEITDQNTISELYDILSTSRKVTKKTSLKPDYIFQFVKNAKEVSTYEYVAGIGNPMTGNLFDGNKIYYVSTRLDSDLLSDFWDLDSPKNFDEVYYNSILTAVNYYAKKGIGKKKMGIDIFDDTDSLKYMLSVNIDQFEKKLKNLYGDKIQLIKDSDDKKNYNIIVNVQTAGYKSDVYKSAISITDITDNTESDYYIYNKYSDDKWNIQIYKNNKPSDF